MIRWLGFRVFVNCGAEFHGALLNIDVQGS
jgi:hypothetical protein